jgi:chromosome segregation ATPase
MAVARLESGVSQAETLVSQIQDGINRLDSVAPTEVWALNGEIDRKFQLLDQLLSRMTGDLRGAGEDRSLYEDEIRQSRESYNRLRGEFERKRNSQQERQAAATGIAAGNAATANLDEAIDLAHQDNRELRRQMEVLGDDRTRLEHVQQNVEQVDQEALKGSARLKRMWWRALAHKFLVWIIVVVLAAVLVVVCAVKWKKWMGTDKQTGTPTPTPEAMMWLGGIN